MLGACSTIVSGRSQNIAVATEPPGAACDLSRSDGSTVQKIATVSETPGTALVEKTKYDITIVCHKAGFQDAMVVNKSGTEAATVGNVIAGGLIGWGIDSATGADNKYDSPVTVTLIKQ